jgi:hypothetical protein
LITYRFLKGIWAGLIEGKRGRRKALAEKEGIETPDLQSVVNHYSS